MSKSRSKQRHNLFSSTLTFNDLPFEIQVMIFLNLPLETQKFIRGVCTSWQAIFESHLDRAKKQLQQQETLKRSSENMAFAYLDADRKLELRLVSRRWNSIFQADEAVLKKLKEGNKKRLESIKKEINEIENRIRDRYHNALATEIVEREFSISRIFLLVLNIHTAMLIIHSIILSLCESRFDVAPYKHNALSRVMLLVIFATLPFVDFIIDQLGDNIKLLKLKNEKARILKKFPDLESENVFTDKQATLEKEETPKETHFYHGA